ncbi:3'-5' exonuclease [Ectothiorhodospiraceae bacterium 2226]|nr:3'-5' exonuclease [Ectothiorhodospiraceae bacterium 2226]
MTRFAAIDFETACYRADSACAVGIVIVEDGRIVERLYQVIRPPTRWFSFTHIHGLTWADVQDAQAFDAVWEGMAQALEGIAFFAAHNAPFDRGVLAACCTRYGLPAPAPEFVCTVRLARAQWNVRPTKLPDVCRYLGIRLNHHHAGSDAEACAQIVIAAQQEGWRYACEGTDPGIAIDSTGCGD